MESKKVKEIKKVLEEGQFNTITHHQKEGNPIKISFADILTLINELESENEKWQRKAINYYQMAKSYGIECIIDSDIDETLKEFIDDGARH